MQGLATNLVLRADDGAAHLGDSNPFNVIPQPTITWQNNAGLGTLEIAWSGVGFRLQAQTNRHGINIPTNWYDYPGGTSSPVTLQVDPAKPSIFYRLVGP